MKESTPRRIAAGALFTAAVGLSVGAISAPAQADALTSHTGLPSTTTAYTPASTPNQANGGGLDFLPLAQGQNHSQYGDTGQGLNGNRYGDTGQGLNDDQHGYSPDRTREDYGRGSRNDRVDNGNFYGDRHGRGEDRDGRRNCRPERIRPYQGDEETIGYEVRPIDQGFRGDERYGRDDRDCPPRICHHPDHHHGRHHDRRDCRHSPGRDAPRDR